MKTVLLLTGLFVAHFVFAQGVARFERIAVARNKTVSLVFPYSIQSVDRGSEQVLVQKSADNILKVKAAVDSFPESSITIITADGKLFSLLVSFDENPVKLHYFFGDSSSVKAIHPLEKLCDKVLKQRSTAHSSKYSSGKMSIEWQGWFISGNKLFCKLKFTNRSSIGYDIEQFHLYLRDNLVAKRTASQEIEQKPLHVFSDSGTIKARASRIMIIALEKFTIPDDKHFAVEILERNGGRHLYLRSYNRQLMQAKEL